MKFMSPIYTSKRCSHNTHVTHHNSKPHIYSSGSNIICIMGFPTKSGAPEEEGRGQIIKCHK